MLKKVLVLMIMLSVTAQSAMQDKYNEVVPEINMSLMDLVNSYQNVYDNIVNNPEAVKAIKAQLAKTEYTIIDFYSQLIYACNDDSEKPYMLIAKMLD